eukprot:TRINITY_DN7394_c0_g1_i1.p1 TRINITY_DN7394_c0_g1~~TRINITY_DN7394_c0_g1_i1.p1  ORF type:complete len:380 (+),score=42.44 TRINITY_DN7394_c0_g1_i1:80-1141(+)
MKVSNDDKDVAIGRLPFSSYFSMRADGAFVYEGKNQEEGNRLVYYEITLNELASHRRFSFGFAEADFPARGIAVGGYQNSYGFTINGKMTHNDTTNAVAIPDGYFKQGDTVGIGLCFDSFNQWNLFCTKNGQILKHVTEFGSVAKGMHLYPVMSVDGPASLSFNFDGAKVPFVAAASVAALSTSTHTNNYIDALPKELLQQILRQAATTAAPAALAWPRVSKTWAEVSSHNDIWRSIYMNSWPNQNPRLKVKDWKKFFVRRHQRSATKLSDTSKEVPTQYWQIENCTFEFECPLLWQNLAANPDPAKRRERHCDRCNQTVVLVDSVRELKQAVELGKCVALNNTRRLMGRMCF